MSQDRGENPTPEPAWNPGPALPAQGQPRDQVLAELDAAKEGDADWRRGRTWSLVYDGGEEHAEFLKQAHGRFFSENALNPMAFKSLKRLEHEVIRAAVGLFRAPEEASGTMTSGGTESCLLAVKTWRDYARRTKPWIRRPEMVVAETVHVAWQKAAAYFDVKLKYVGLDNQFRMDASQVARAIGRNAVLVVASAPEYPHGMIDPIAEIGAISAKRRVPLHVDACVGGFLLPFAEELGYPIPAFDFRVPGVSSLSADLHKYGYAAKGASLILYRSLDQLEHQFFVSESWPGGIFFSPALLGTRSGGPIAAAWAALRATGRDGYLANARVIMETTRRFVAGVRAIPGLETVGDPPASLVAFRSTDPKLNIFALGDRLERRGWHIDRLQNPEALHAMVMLSHAGVVDAWLRDLAEAAGEVRADPALAKSGSAPMYGMVAKMPVRGLVRREIVKMVRELYGSSGAFPKL